MGAQPRFSVIVNIYNGARFLREAIDSVLQQTWTDWEMLLWDDGSTDESLAVCRGYADSRIRIVAQAANAGLGHARNQAIGSARGEWIAFLDQDDVWLPNKLAAQAALLTQDGAGELGLLYGRTLRFDGTGRQRPFDGWYGSGPLPEGDLLALLIARPSFIAFSSAAFLAEALRRLGPIPADIQFCPDYYLTVAVSRRYRAACVQGVCCLYRVHGESMSHVHRTRIHEEAIRVVESLALPRQARLVRRRRRVHETWIGVERVRGGDWRGGTAHVLRQGSAAYLLLRPAVLLGRGVREAVRRFGGRGGAGLG